MSCEKGHSEDYFGEERDFWWNKDFLELLAKRWRLDKYAKLLDVGSGQCHWSKLLCPYLKKPREVYALDYDEKWALGDEGIKTFFKDNETEVTFVQGNAEALPFPDEYFDVVTCQTVLIHLKNPLEAINEMKRVLKKRGLIICVDMNNIAGTLVRDSILKDEEIDEALDRIKYHLIYEKGKKLLGEGDNSIGDLLPGMFSKAGFKSIQVYLSDKASPMYPPYHSPEEKATIDTLKKWVINEEGELDYSQALRYFKAISNEPANIEFFNKQYIKNKEHYRNILDSIEKNEFSTGGAYVMYVVSGEKE